MQPKRFASFTLQPIYRLPPAPGGMVQRWSECIPFHQLVIKFTMMSHTIKAQFTGAPFTHHEDITRLLNYAKVKLLDRGTPLHLKATAYFRICCTALGKLYQSVGVVETAYACDKEPTPERLYAELLSALCQHNLNWWHYCWVSDHGMLQSTDPVIEKLLQPLTDFIASYTGELPYLSATPLMMARVR